MNLVKMKEGYCLLLLCCCWEFLAILLFCFEGYRKDFVIDVDVCAYETVKVRYYLNGFNCYQISSNGISFKNY